jgi:hypothetical protein
MGEIAMCFGLEWFMHVLIMLVIVCGVIALLRLLVAFVLPRLGLGGEIVAFIVSAAYIVMWVVICIAAIYFIFSLVSCLIGSGGAALPRLR